MKSQNINLFIEKYFSVIFIAFIIVFRILTIYPIETGGDSFYAWYTAKHCAFFNNYVPNHISLRFGKILPAALFIKLFGYSLPVYYVAPIVFYFVSVFTLFKIAKLLSDNTIIPYISVILFVSHKEIARYSNYLMPTIFSITYILIAYYFLEKYFRENKKNQLVIIALFIFLAYLTKITNLFIVPGFFISMLYKQKRIKPIFIISIILLFLFGIETIIINMIFNEPSRIHVVLQTHLSNNSSLQPVSNIWNLLFRYKNLDIQSAIYLGSSILVMLIVLIKKIRHNYLPLFIIFISFILILTFSIKSIDPIVPALPFVKRYLYIFLPLTSLILPHAIYVVYSKIRKNNLKNRYGKNNAYSLLFICMLLLIIYNGPKAKNLYKILKINSVANSFTYLYENKVPIIIISRVTRRYVRVVDSIHKQMKDGTSFDDALRMYSIKKNYYEYSLNKVQKGGFKGYLIFKYLLIDYQKTRSNRMYRLPFYKIEIDGVLFGLIYNSEKNQNELIADIKKAPLIIIIDRDPFSLEVVNGINLEKYL